MHPNQPEQTPDSSQRPAPRRFWLLALFATAAAAIVSACKTCPKSTAPATSPAPEPGGVIGPIAARRGSARSSSASSPKAYRQDAASHLYGLNEERIFKGRLPPLLYAIGVLNVDIDRVGRVTQLTWLRAPRQAPEMVAEVEQLVRSASPFPVPTRLGKVVYTDTWLWHKDGRFQLDTLTEGQD
jgi:hypothetical protein